MRKTFASPFHERMQNDFSIATALKNRAVGFQFEPQLMVIKYFAVEDDNHVAIRADQRLVAAFQVNNAQARRAQRDKF